MRSFPRAARRRLTAATAAVVVAAGFSSAPILPVNDDLDDRQDRVERKLDSAHDDLEHSSKRLRRATGRLQAAEAELDTARERLSRARGELTAARARDAAMQAKLEAAEARLEQARAELSQGRAELAAQRDEVADMIASIYTRGDPQLLGLASVLESEDPADITRRMEAMDVMVGKQTRAYDELRAAEVLLTVRRDRVQAAKEEVAARRAEAARQLELRKRLERRAEQATTRVEELVEQRGEARRAANRARRADQAEIRELKAEQQRIGEMLRKRAERARRRATRSARRDRGGSASRSSNPGGYLSSPVDGYITSSFGMRTHPIYGYRSLHDGTDFGSSAGCGTPLRAAAPGKVISRYYQTAYGNRLIIDHGYVQGVGLAAIYNHAIRYTVGVGEHVARGEVIGYMGTTGWSTGCHLHFTVMANGSPVNPVSWL